MAKRPEPATEPATGTPTGSVTEAAVEADPNADVPALAYEQARDELTGIVDRLETGQVSLEESMALWRRGEALAAHCSQWLEQAQSRVDAMVDAMDDV